MVVDWVWVVVWNCEESGNLGLGLAGCKLVGSDCSWVGVAEEIASLSRCLQDCAIVLSVWFRDYFSLDLDTY